MEQTITNETVTALALELDVSKRSVMILINRIQMRDEFAFDSVCTQSECLKLLQRNLVLLKQRDKSIIH